jgi:putative beta-1,4-xylosyltransferase IRX10
VQTFGQENHVCLKDGSIIIPPYAPPQKMQAHLITPDTPRSIFVYFRGLFYDVGNDPEGGYYARSVRSTHNGNFRNVHVRFFVGLSTLVQTKMKLVDFEMTKVLVK